MTGDKDEKKQLAPFFPSMHISHGDKGGNRNRMAQLEEGSVYPELRPRPRPSMPVPPGNGCSAIFPQTSSGNVAGVKRKDRPISDLYYSPCSGGVSGSVNYPNPMKSKCISVQPPCGFASYTHCCTDENDFGVSSFLQSYGSLQLHVKKEKFDGFSPVNLHGGSSRQLKETDLAMSSSNGNSLIGNRISDPGIGGGNLNQMNKNRSDFPLCLEFKSLHKSKSVADGMSARKATPELEDSARSSPRGGDCEQWLNAGLIKDCSHDNDSMGDTVRCEEESFDAYAEGSILGLDLSRDEVALVIGPRLFLKARKTMVHQQKTFSLQMFELHRLITVQRHIARSPEILDPSKPSIKFPPINKLLYVSPLDPSPSFAKAKTDTLKPDLATECGLLPFPTTDFKKEHYFPQPKSLPNIPPSIPVDPKLSPWCIPMPSGNQWLVPVRSPSEGLIYKPYPGPCFPSFMAPGYGSCPSLGLSSLGGGGGSSYNVPPPNEHASENYLQPYATPIVHQSGSNPELSEFDKTSNLFRVSSQNGSVSECGGNLHGSNGNEMQGSRETSPSERLDGDALSLFPTTPSLQPLKEQKVHAIKAVPHNRMSASASAARIFQSIQEGRRSRNE